MIQRIQTVYLLLALLLLGFLAFLPLGEIAVGTEVYNFSIKGVFNNGESVANGWPMMVLLGVIELLQLIIIFSFKKRVRQMRMATYNLILMLGLFGVGFYFVHSSINTLGGGAFSYELAVAFPIVAAILQYLAIRAIGKDEALVRSIDRIR